MDFCQLPLFFLVSFFVVVVVLFCFVFCLLVCLFFCFCFVFLWFFFFFFFRSSLNPSCLSKFNKCFARRDSVSDCSNGSSVPAVTCCNQNSHAKLVRIVFSFALTRS